MVDRTTIMTVPGLVRMIPWIIAVFSGSAGGAVTVAALQTEPLSVNEIIRSEAKILSVLGSQRLELERIYSAISAFDKRQRALHTTMTELRVITHGLQRYHDEAS